MIGGQNKMPTLLQTVFSDSDMELLVPICQMANIGFVIHTIKTKTK